jgi:hypothetical protein
MGARQRPTRSLRLFVWVFGPPLTSSRAAALLYVRRVYLKLFALLMAPYALAVALKPPTWAVAALAVGASAWLFGFSFASVELWRARRQ